MKTHFTYLIIVTLLIGTFAATRSPQAPPKELRAERFVLVDADGNDAATLRMHEGGTWLSLTIPGRGTGIELGCYKDGSVEFRTRGLDGSARLAVNKSGYPTLQLNHLRQSATLALEQEGEFDLSFEDENGMRRASLRLRNQNVMLEALDAAGASKWRIPSSF